MYRRLGEQPADAVNEVDEIVDIPYRTILDRAAGDAAEIEMVGEALAAAEIASYLERSAGDDVQVDVEQLQDVSIHTPSSDDTTETAANFAEGT